MELRDEDIYQAPVVVLYPDLKRFCSVDEGGRLVVRVIDTREQEEFNFLSEEKHEVLGRNHLQ